MKTLLRSFAGGEITPELAARLDTTKWQTGLAKCLNFEIRPHGPAVNRAGTSYVLDTKDSSKKSVLLPFIYSTTQAYVLEFGDQYMRIHAAGATVLETGLTITGITRASVGVLTYTGTDPSNGDTMYLSGITGMTELNGRFVTVANVDGALNTFELKDLNGTNINTTAFTAWSAGGTAARVYTLATPYLEADLPALEFTQSSDVLTITHVGYKTRELARVGATNWTLTAVLSAPSQAAPTGVTVTPNAAGGTTYTYVVTAINADGLEESLESTAGTNAACQALTVGGAFNTVTWTNASGALRYNIYKKVNGLYGYIGQSGDGTIGFVDNNITPDVGQTPPETDDPIDGTAADGTDNHPGAVAHHQGRRWFAGTRNKPQNIFATRSGTESNFTYSFPTRDDDAISARLTSRQNNTIRHLIALDDMIALNSGAVWKIDAGGNAGPITPSNIDYRVQGVVGAAVVRPVLTSNAILYSADRGAHINEIKFSWQAQGYPQTDISIMAAHLFDGYTITSMTFTSAPFPTLWCVRSDGILLGATYVPEHEIVAWHQHDTDGLFESVCAIPENGVDMLYCIVKRTIGATTKRFVERKESRAFATLADSFVVDCGLQYSGTPATSIGGLYHLVGETVAILADGAVQPQQVVAADGTVTLDHSASKVSVGLPITADLETLPLQAEVEAFGQGTNKNINKLYVSIYQSGSLFVGPSFTKLTETKWRTNEPYGSPPSLRTGTVPVTIKPQWDNDAAVCIRVTDPLPLTVRGLIPDTAYGG